MIRDLIAVTVVGLTFGLICGKLRLPAPAPPTIVGAIGVAAVTIGYLLGRTA